MTPRTGYILAALLVTATGWLAVTLCLPLPAWTPPTAQPIRATPTDSPAPAPLTLDDLRVIWERDLRQELIDQPKPVRERRKPEPPPPVALVGTVVEPNRAYGLFQLDGRTLLRAVDEEIAGGRVLEIHRGSAILDFGGRRVELKVPWFEKL